MSILILILLTIPNITSYSNKPANQYITSQETPLVVVFGNSIEENTALETLLTYVPNAVILTFDWDTIDTIKTSNVVFFIGHGSIEGIKFQREVISWAILDEFTMNASFTSFIACDSSGYNDSNTFGFPGKIDAILAVVESLFRYAIFNLDIDLMINLFDLYEERVTAIENGALELILANTESGYNLGVKDQYKSKKKWGVTYYKEHIMWLNGAPWVSSILMTAIGAGLGAVSALGWVTTLAVMLGVSAGLLGAILILVVAVMGITFIYNQAQRTRGDFMIGIGAVLIPYPTMKVWIDNGNDNYNNNKKYTVGLPNPSAILWYYAISGLQNSWYPLIR